jgi:hypothetical protein
MMNKPDKSSRLPVTLLELKPGNFTLGSAASRAAARAQLQHNQEEEEWERTRPPDVRVIWGIPRPRQRMENEVRRTRNGDQIIEEIFPAPLYPGENLGCCSVEPTNISVEETLRLLREQRRQENEGSFKR